MPKALDAIHRNDYAFEGEDLYGITQELWDRKKLRQRRPSSTLWQFILVIGDGVLLLFLIALVLEMVPSLYGKHVILDDSFGIWHAKLLGACIALAIWCFAANITQAQSLAYASNRFKSSLCALFALVLIVIFWMVLIHPLAVSGFITQAQIGLFFLALATPAFITWRVLFAEIINLPRFRRRAVIVGVDTAGKTLAKELLSRKHPAISILGYISESIDERVQQNGLPVLGGKSTLRHLVDRSMIDVIIMALDYKVNLELFQEAIKASELGISVIPMVMMYESISGKIPVEHVGEQWHLALPAEGVTSPFYSCWHIAMNLIFGICGLLLLCLVFPIVAMLIYLDSPGPIFYRQERLGLQGRPFYINKFRSMGIDAERPGQAIWTTEHDTRITKVGRFLRATHLDELPQVLNILRGEMSLIGPRPERAAFVTELEKSIPFYRCRLAVKPGLTGWAQVKYRYGNTSNDALAKLQYDLYYIKRRSFMLDVFIMLKTVIEVLFRRGT